MAISKKNSRLINCDGREFRWTISPASDYIKFIAESAEKAGRKIEVAINSDINRLWLEFPNISNLKLRVIKPNEAASLILQALRDGWKPEEKGIPIKYKLQGNELQREEKK